MRSGPFHSLNAESFFLNTAGLKIVEPSSAYETKRPDSRRTDAGRRSFVKIPLGMNVTGKINVGMCVDSKKETCKVAVGLRVRRTTPAHTTYIIGGALVKNDSWRR